MSIQAETRSILVRGAVRRAVSGWQRARREEAASARAINSLRPEDVLKAIPSRAQRIDPEQRRQSLPYLEPLTFKTSIWRSLARLFTWLGIFSSVVFGNFADRLVGRSSVEKEAIRLRSALQRAGGTFVKIGQQLAMRIDLLPWAYCVELSRMLDRMPPFPVEQALKAVERSLGRPWQEVFAVFDPEPVGSASIACVYQAVLQDGSKVVVKVRRPRVAELFMADLQVLDWITQAAEFLTLIRPGFTRNLRMQFRQILTEELDFRREGRFQDIFRRNSGKSGQDFFTAPRVYFDLSGADVLVQEFVSGLWLWEVISAVEQKDPKGRLLLRQLNIDPAVVARRILWVNFWSCDENIFYHADPHPANILIRPNNELTFIDFGSCGSFNDQQLVALERMVLSMKDRDMETMARAAISLMEPLPPIDVPALMKVLQEEYVRVYHTFNTPAQYTQYWERTTARQWLVLIRIAQKFGIPMNLHTLRMIRATLLYDSIVLRLDHQLDRFQEYLSYMKDRAELVKQRWRRRLREDAGDNVFLRLEELGQSLDDLIIRAQSTLDRPIVNLGSTIDKWIFTASVLSRMTGRILLVTVFGIVLVNVESSLAGASISLVPAFLKVAQNTLYQLFLAAAVVFNTRHILFRLRDRDFGRRTAF